MEKEEKNEKKNIEKKEILHPSKKYSMCIGN